MSQKEDKTWLRIGTILLEIDTLKHYANLVEKSLASEAEEIAEFRRQQGTSCQFDEELWNVESVFPYLQRNASLPVFFAFYEHKMNLICDWLKTDKNKTLSVADLKGRGLRRARAYMVKEIGVSFPDDHDSWQELLRLAEVRNVIAHRDGLVEEDRDKKIFDFVGDSDYVFVAGGQVRLREGALSKIVDHMNLFFRAMANLVG